jgi:DNA polymerase (family 10)
VVDAAVRRNVALEINASPERLDLHDTLLHAAKLRGARFVIDTDSHHPQHLANMRYGVTMARRGWLEASDIVNTLPLKEFQEQLTAL